MHAALNLVRALGLGILTLLLVSPAVAGPGADPAVVRAVLFYAPDCVQCGDLFAFYLPGLFERHGARLEIAGIDATQGAGAEIYAEAANRYPLPPHWNGVPAVVVADHALAGLDAIAETLGDRFGELLGEAGARRWPSLPGLGPALSEAIRDLRARVAEERAPALVEAFPAAESAASERGQRLANALAVAVLMAMVAAAWHSLLRLRRAAHAARRRAGWIMVTLLTGLGISAYTAYTALAGVAPACGPIGSCAAVQSSEYAKFFGVPMGVLGLFGYAAILLTWLLARWRTPQGGAWRWVSWAIALAGVLFSLRLTALEAFVIRATCLWCLGSALTMSTLLWLLSGEMHAARRTAGLRRDVLR